MTVKNKPTCLDSEYKGVKYKYTWRCSEGHIWLASWDKINGVDKTWCPKCNGNVKDKIENLQNFAIEKNGTCLSNTYINVHHKYKWKCKESHKWLASWYSVKSKKSWCPYCANNKVNHEDQIIKMKEESEKNGITLVSKKYINSSTKYVFMCRMGHKWNGLYGNIKKGQGCPVCSGHNTNIEKLKIYAISKSGKCLDKEYINSRHKYKWKCKENHIWQASWTNVNQGKWCKTCSRNKR